MSRAPSWGKYITPENQRWLDACDITAITEKQFIMKMKEIYYFLPKDLIERAASSKWKCYNEKGYLEKFNEEVKKLNEGKSVSQTEGRAYKIINESIEKKDDFSTTVEGCYKDNLDEKGNPIIEHVPDDESASRSLFGEAVIYEVNKDKMFPIEVKTDQKEKQIPIFLKETNITPGTKMDEESNEDILFEDFKKQNPDLVKDFENDPTILKNFFYKQQEEKKQPPKKSNFANFGRKGSSIIEISDQK